MKTNPATNPTAQSPVVSPSLPAGATPFSARILYGASSSIGSEIVIEVKVPGFASQRDLHALIAAAPELRDAIAYLGAVFEAMSQAERDALPNGIVNAIGSASDVLAKL
jgi:hypothetical protein